MQGNYESISQYFNLLADDDDGIDDGYEYLDGFVIERQTHTGLRESNMKYLLKFKRSDLVRN